MIATDVDLSVLNQDTYTLVLKLKDRPDFNMIESLKNHCNDNKMLDITVKKHRKKRSLDANSALWLLLQRLATALNTTKDELYLSFLEQYGTFTHIIVKENAVESIMREWRTVRNLGKVDVNGKTGIQLQCYYGSSAMNSYEFYHLMQGVVNECKELGIETLTDKEFKSIIDNYYK